MALVVTHCKTRIFFSESTEILHEDSKTHGYWGSTICNFDAKTCHRSTEIYD